MRFTVHETEAALQELAVNGAGRLNEVRDRGHLARCSDCQDRVRQFRALQAAVQAHLDTKLDAISVPSGLLDHALAEAARSDASSHLKPIYSGKATPMKQALLQFSYSVPSLASVRRVRAWSGGAGLMIALALGSWAGFWVSQRQIDAGLGPTPDVTSQAAPPNVRSDKAASPTDASSTHKASGEAARVQAYVRSRQYTKAVPELRQLVRRFPRNSTYSRWLAESLAAVGKEQEAAGLYRKLMTTAEQEGTLTGQSSLLTDLAALYVRMGHNEQAVPLLRRALKIHPWNLDARDALYKSYIALGEDARAADLVSQGNDYYEAQGRKAPVLTGH